MGPCRKQKGSEDDVAGLVTHQPVWVQPPQGNPGRGAPGAESVGRAPSRGWSPHPALPPPCPEPTLDCPRAQLTGVPELGEALPPAGFSAERRARSPQEGPGPPPAPPGPHPAPTPPPAAPRPLLPHPRPPGPVHSSSLLGPPPPPSSPVSLCGLAGVEVAGCRDGGQGWEEKQCGRQSRGVSVGGGRGHSPPPRRGGKCWPQGAGGTAESMLRSRLSVGSGPGCSACVDPLGPSMTL